MSTAMMDGVRTRIVTAIIVMAGIGDNLNPAATT